MYGTESCAFSSHKTGYMRQNGRLFDFCSPAAKTHAFDVVIVNLSLCFFGVTSCRGDRLGDPAEITCHG